MTGPASSVARIVVVLAAIAICAAPTATAVAPPPVDDSLLPEPGPPAPPQPTEQQEQCFVATAAADLADAAVSSQLEGLELQAVWKLSRGAGQTVAVIDTGVSRHRLLPHLLPGGDYVSTGDGTQDCDGHGTIVAGIIGAAPQSTVHPQFSGVAPDSTIISIRQSSNKFGPVDEPTGSGFGDVDTLAMAVRTAADVGATVINVSSVACVSVAAALDDRALGAALAYAVDVKNVVVVAAGGNVGGPGQCPDQNPAADPGRPGQPNWDTVNVVVSPAWYDDYVLTVGSVGPDGAPSRFSLAGPWVDVAAPGEGIVSLDPDGEGLIDTLPAFGSAMHIAGTSYAAPMVSGVAALVRARSPQLTARQVMQRIEDTAHRPPAGWDPVMGRGVVDALAAVSGDSPTPSTAANAGVPGTDTRRIAPPPVVANPADLQPRRVAFGGAAICVAVVVATVAATASTSRLRRRRNAVTGK
jgi:membrane-anchored mycosin MYCP